MPIEEFVYAVRDFRRDDFNELLEKIRYLVSNRDIDGMKKLLISQMEKKDKKEPFASFNTILIKITGFIRRNLCNRPRDCYYQ